MKSLIDLLQSVLLEEGARCGVATARDWETISSRYEHEGWSFLGITLPSFDKDLQRALANGRVDSSLFRAFARKKGSMLPEFLHGFMENVFEPESGVLMELAYRDVPVDLHLQVDFILAIRQITGLLGKVELDCSPTRVRSAYDKFLQNESHVREYDSKVTISMMAEARATFHLLFGRVMTSWQNKVLNQEILPKHGPGAVANRLRGNAKWQPRSWPSRLEEVFPLGRYGYSSYSLYLRDVEDGVLDEPGTEMPSRLIDVPKTLSSPRLIAIEPSWMQYIQQGMMAAYEDALKSDPLAYSMVSYASQVPNQELARHGSIGGNSPDAFATLDLSDASDLVSNQLVRGLLRDWPHLLEAVDACRTRSVDVLGKTHRLAKFASMGSALTFPIESLVFATLTWVGIRRSDRNHSLRTRIKSGVVRAYGDDIVVPVRHAQSVAATLEAFGLKVNSRKSFWEGYFRESCGKEYYRGYDVTIVRIRQVLPDLRHLKTSEGKLWASLVAFRNLAYWRGLWNTVRLLDSWIEDVIPFPAVGPDSPALGRQSVLGYQTERLDSDLQIPLVKAFRVKSEIPSSPLDDVGALMKFFSSSSDLPNPDEKHLLRAGRPLSLRIKRGWVRSY